VRVNAGTSAGRRFDKAVTQASMIGVPFFGGQPKGGVDRAPSVMREIGVRAAIEGLGWKVNDVGDVTLPPCSDDDLHEHVKRPRYVGESCRRTFEYVYTSAKAGNFVFTIGGDHSIAVGTIAGVLKARPDACVIWVDAHADINTTSTSPTGNLHGMPVSFLMGLEKMRVMPGFEWLDKEGVPLLPTGRIAYIGLRDVDDGEKSLLASLGILAFSMEDVDRLGIYQVMEEALNAVNPLRDRPIHLSFDVDGIDASIVPATGTAVDGGLTYREARVICEVCEGTGLLGSFDLVEINPDLSDARGQQSTLETSLMLVKTVFGRKLL